MNRSDDTKNTEEGFGWSRAGQDAAEAKDPWTLSPRVSAWPTGGALWGARGATRARPRWQLCLSVLSLLFASVIALVLLVVASPGIFCTTVAESSGANIRTGAGIALAAGAIGLLAIGLVRNEPGLLRPLLLAEAAALSVAVGFVARDGAVSRQTESCSFLDSSSTSTSTHHVAAVYAYWGVAIALLVVQARRGRRARPRRTLTVAVPALAAVAVLVAVVPAYGGGDRNGAGKVRRLPQGILVCRAFQAPEVFGGAQCYHNVDVGRAPIRRPDGLMCATYLSGVRRKLIGIQVYRDGTLIKHANIRSSEPETSPYAYFDSNDLETQAQRLPAGSYRCRFLVNGKIVRDRTIRVGRP